MNLKQTLFACGIAAIVLGAAPAFAADNEPGKHDTAKGAAAGAVIGHEMGSGHAAAGAATGAAIGHHEKTKAQRNAGQQGQQ
jgi:hypothetical protein